MNSPYNALSAFAGNPLLISPEWLVEDGLLEADDLRTESSEPLRNPSESDASRVDFAAAGAWKAQRLRTAFEAFRRGGHGEGLGEELESFRNAPEQAAWLEDWCLFAALHGKFEGRAWWLWPEDLALWSPIAVEGAREQEREEVDFHRFVQFLFSRQWQRLRYSAADRGIRLLGDLPIYVSGHSADVWANRELFELAPDGSPAAMAGVPPDDFSEDGQLWGNPLYRWESMAEDGYRWWCDRLAANLCQTDLVRLDHFRGFAAYWRVPAGAPTAREGEWVNGPGRALFDAFQQRFGELPLVAEDLGVITEEVRQLRRDCQLPGMRVLQFGFDSPESEHAPHRVGADALVYTGTHDNDTSVGWFSSLNPELKERVLEAVGGGEGASQGGNSQDSLGGFVWGLIQTAYVTRAVAAMVPVQDVLGLGSEGRMNVPGTASGNWEWRMGASALTPAAAGRLRELADRTDRLPIVNRTVET